MKLFSPHNNNYVNKEKLRVASQMQLLAKSFSHVPGFSENFVK